MQQRIYSLLLAGLLVATVTGPVRAANGVPAELQMIADEARGGEPGAQLLYGLAYLEGRDGLTPDAKQATYWLRRAARNDNPYAQLVLGTCYAEGKGVDKDPEQAVRWWRQSSRNDNPQAQYLLGKAILEGTGAPKNPARAIDWLSQSAEQGNKDAQYLIGKMYYEGYAVAQDKKLAKDWLSRAAAQGHSHAINLLARFKDALDLTTMVYQHSPEVLKAMANKGDPQAQYELGLRYESGAWDVQQDNDKALAWITRAAQAGNHIAMKTLADIYRHGDLGLAADPARAAEWDRKAKTFR